MKLKALSLIILIPNISPAFTVDQLIKFSNQENYFLITGSNDKQREYINITLSELKISKEKSSQEVNYTENNIDRWPIIAEPAEIIVNSREKVKVKITNNYTPSEDDRVFGITFTPDSLKNDNEKNYTLTFGYKAWYIIPGSKPMKGYLDVTKQGEPGDYIINNQTNKVMIVNVNYCDKGNNNDNCISEIVTAPYTNKKISLGEVKSQIKIIFYLGGSKDTPPVKTMTI